MATKQTNKQILEAVATASAQDAATYGVTPDIRTVAAAAANNDPVALMSLSAGGTPIYSAMLGLLIKVAYTPLRWARYTDLYERHHRNMIQGKPERNWIGIAKMGTGNNAAGEVVNEQLSQAGQLSTLVTAQAPDVVTLVNAIQCSYSARVPISEADYRNAFTTEYGLANFIAGVRQSLENAIVAHRNHDFDQILLTSAKEALPIASGERIEDNVGKAVYVKLTLPSVSAAMGSEGPVVSVVDDAAEGDLKALFTTLKAMYSQMTGRPNEMYNALGVANNTPPDAMICYLDSRVYARLSVLSAWAPNARELRDQGLEIRAISAPWLGTKGPDGNPVIGAMGSVDWIVDYPTADFSKVVETDRGYIVSRFLDTQMTVAGFEQWCFMTAAAAK